MLSYYSETLVVDATHFSASGGFITSGTTADASDSEVCSFPPISPTETAFPDDCI